jgi:putative transferase (TIGR04331 family)
MMVALARVGGEKVIQCQHGSGDYGTANATPATHLISFRSDAFITWGWSAQGDYDVNFVPLPSPWLSRYVRRRRRNDGRAIFVAPTQRYRMTRINSGWRATAGVTDIRDILRFIGGLSPEVRRALAYRPYRIGNSDVDDGRLVQKHFPDLPLVSGDIEEKIIRCRLYLGTGLSTTLNAAMAANVPTVFYFDPESFPLCRQAQPYFDALHDVSILHYDPVAAAEHASRIWPDVESWWATPRVREAHRAWVRNFARAEPWGWALTWGKALRRL